MKEAFLSINLFFAFSLLPIVAYKPNVVGAGIRGGSGGKEKIGIPFAYVNNLQPSKSRSRASPILKSIGLKLCADKSEGFIMLRSFPTVCSSNKVRLCRPFFAIPWRSWAPLTSAINGSDDLSSDGNGGIGGFVGDNRPPYGGPSGSFVGNMGPMWDLISPRYAEANARFSRLSPNKVNRTITEIGGMSIVQALAHLSTSPRRPAYCVFRCIQSALYNAKDLYKGGADLKPRLISVTANRGPVFKRPFFRAKGKMDIRRRPTTHIKVIVQV